MKSPGGKVGEETSPVNKKKKEKANKQATWKAQVWPAGRTFI